MLKYILSMKSGNCEVYRNDEAARRADAAITEGLNCATNMSALKMFRTNNVKIIFETKICIVVRRLYRVVIV